MPSWRDTRRYLAPCGQRGQHAREHVAGGPGCHRRNMRRSGPFGVVDGRRYRPTKYQQRDRQVESHLQLGRGTMISRIDHVVVNCRDVEAMADWYERVLGFEREEFFGPIRRIALKFGQQKINLRPSGASNWMTGEVDPPGALDLCFITDGPISAAIERFGHTGRRHHPRPRRPEGSLGGDDLNLLPRPGGQFARDCFLRNELAVQASSYCPGPGQGLPAIAYGAGIVIVLPLRPKAGATRIAVPEPEPRTRMP